MLQILQSDTEILIRSGFIYLPLMLDESIENELRQSRPDEILDRPSPQDQTPDPVLAGGGYFIKSISVSSLLANYEKFDPETYEYMRRNVFSKFMRALNAGSFSIDEDLRTIIFQVMPHFIRKKNRLRRERATGEDILDLILRKTDIPARFHEESNRLADVSALQRKLLATAAPATAESPPFSGLGPTRTFRRWFFRVLQSRILEEEKQRLAHLLYDRERFSTLHRRYIAALLYVKERGAIEVDGCGFFRNGATSEYFVYARTGPYALKDFYQRVYLFPDCRVAVSTYGPLVPYVIDQYKHPFLKAFDRMQKICVRGDFVPAESFSAAGAIQAIEEGVNALFHGYNSRRGNGYNRLDAMRFERNKIVFEEYRIQPDDPRIASGEVEVKNDFY